MKFIYMVVDDNELEGVDAKTEFSKGVVIITCRSSVYDRAEMGVGRTRMTLAHELAHVVHHHSVPMFRVVGATGVSDLAKNGAAHTSAEHQAKVFAAAFLIHDDDAAQMTSAQEISEQFRVSLRAAEICFERLRRAAERQQSAERVRKIADETIATLGVKALCDNSDFVGDLFQDGDRQDRR